MHDESQISLRPIAGTTIAKQSVSLLASLAKPRAELCINGYGATRGFSRAVEVLTKPRGNDRRQQAVAGER